MPHSSSPNVDAAPSAVQAVLLVVAHGDEDEAVLREAKCDVRTVSSVADAVALASEWRADTALVDLAIASTSEDIAAIKTAHRCRTIALAPVADGRFIALADRSVADALVFRPLKLAHLRRVGMGLDEAAEPEPAVTPVELPPFVGESSEAMREVWQLVTLAAQGLSSIVITGETGVGKEVVARALHRFSRRREGPFVAINTAALPETLLEAEMFGHEKGAFTGASALRRGRFEMADGGTLFLDEIGDLPLGLQAKLLRALQERRFERLGGTQTITVNVRVIAATHRDLGSLVAQGLFRADLYYRLNVVGIHVPPLRERRREILELWDNALAQAVAGEGRRAATTSPEARRLLLQYNWPGNVRELENAAHHAVTVASEETIGVQDLPPTVFGRNVRPSSTSLVGVRWAEIERRAILENYAVLGSARATADVLGISARKVQYRLREYRVADAEQAPVIEKRREERPRILIAEDDDDVRFALSDLLKSQGYEVLAMRDGRGVLDLIDANVHATNESPTDVIISDIRMVGVTGLELLASVRDRGWGNPVVLVSAFADEETRTRAESLGATAVLGKPLDLARLQRIIEAAIAH